MTSVKRRYWLALTLGVLATAVAATPLVLPQLLRAVAIARVEAITGRRASIDGVDIDALSGRLAIRGFRLAERGGRGPFADVERLDLRLHLPSLLRGHLWIHEVVVRNSTVRVVRFRTDEFNFSDLVRSSGAAQKPLDVTVDRFVLAEGTVTLEDRSLPEWRTWTSRDITIDARNLSTRRGDGTAVASSVTAGSPVSVNVEQLRLYPIHLQAAVTIEALDLTLAQLYLPADAPIVIQRGRVYASVKVALDARDGVQIDAAGRFEDVAVARAGEREALALVPSATVRLASLGLLGDELRLGQAEVAGSGAILDARVTPPARFDIMHVRATVADLTWPVRGPARLDLAASMANGGTLSASGALRQPPNASELRVRLAKVDLAPYARYLPPAAKVRGVAEGDVTLVGALSPGAVARARGSVAVTGLSVADARRPLVKADRVEATGFQIQWPSRLTVERVMVSRPWATVERDRAGGLPLVALLGSVGPRETVPIDVGLPPPSPPPPLAVEVREIKVRGGALTWRDHTATPPTEVALSDVEATVRQAAWPPRGVTGVRTAFRSRASLPTRAHVTGDADFDLAVEIAAVGEPPTVRGRAALARVEVRDGERTVMRVERAAATGLDVEWPRRVAVDRVALQRPWALLERDEKGILPLRALLAANGDRATPTDSADAGVKPPTVTVRALTVDDGGLRAVDRSISPPFAVDLQRLGMRLDGLSTTPGPPARIDLTGRIGSEGAIALRGTIASLGGPLGLDLNAEVRDFVIPRTNPYLLRHAAWRANRGWVTTTVHCRIEGDALDAKTDIRVRWLELARGENRDEAQARIGLPLNLIVALMKDPNGEIRVSLPVGGRMSDPRFDFTEAIWGAVRAVAIKAITLPVSWIGRVRFTPDSRIAEIRIEPVRFVRGAPALTPEGQAQVTRLSAFLQQAPEVRMPLTPVVSSGDLEELRLQGPRAAVDRLSREAKISPDAATQRLFRQRFPDREPPSSTEAMLQALAESEPPPTAKARALATQRLEIVQDTLKRLGIDPARLPATKSVEAREAGEGGYVEAGLGEVEKSKRSSPIEYLERLGGAIAR